MIAFKMNNPLVDFDILINHYRMGIMRWEQENSGVLDPDSPSIVSPSAIAGPEQPQSAWQRLFSQTTQGWQSMNEFVQDMAYNIAHHPTHMADY
jgi:hypothetical protein